MCKQSISLELKLGEVEYIDENNIIVPVYMKQKGFEEYKKFFDKKLKFNGQVWQEV